MPRSLLAAVLAATFTPALALAQAQPPAATPTAPATAPAPAPATSTPPPATVAEPVHRGFYVRFDGGVGYLGSSATQGGISVSMNGFAIPFGISVGGAVVPNFIIAGEVWGSLAVSPTFTGGGSSATRSNASFSLVGFGAQLTYYFMPANVYVSVTPSVGLLTLSVDNVSYDAQAGFAGKLAVGKEWWISRKWGLGVAAQFHFGINKDNGTNPPTWTTIGGGAALSVTFN
jgi:hypothetical protein